MYIHIPFCAAKCDYCSFYSIPVEGLSPGSFEDIESRYFIRLIDELELRMDIQGTEIDTVYFGGGTPSLVKPGHIESTLNTLRSCFQILPGAEISIECNPENFSFDRFSLWKSFGINRITLGIQSFNPRLRSLIGRRATWADRGILEKFMTVPGIIHGIDLIAAIHGSTDEELSGDLDHVIECRPEHVSAYMLTVEEGTPLSRVFTAGNNFEDDQRRKFEKTMDTLVENGYIHYEISNFALPSFESKHNLKYWKFAPYIGLGVRAHSFIGGRRLYNNQTLDEYLRGPSILEDRRGGKSAAAEYLMMAFRLLHGFTDREFESMLGSPVPEAVLRSMEGNEKSGMIDIQNDCEGVRFKLTRDGLFLADSVIYDVIETLL